MGEAIGQADRSRQAGALRSSRQDRLGPDVDAHPGHLCATKLAARHIAAVQDHYVQIRVAMTQLPSCCQTADATANDGDRCPAHPASLSAP